MPSSDAHVSIASRAIEVDEAVFVKDDGLWVAIHRERASDAEGCPVERERDDGEGQGPRERDAKLTQRVVFPRAQVRAETSAYEKVRWNHKQHGEISRDAQGARLWTGSDRTAGKLPATLAVYREGLGHRLRPFLRCGRCGWGNTTIPLSFDTCWEPNETVGWSELLQAPLLTSTLYVKNDVYEPCKHTKRHRWRTMAMHSHFFATTPTDGPRELL